MYGHAPAGTRRSIVRACSRTGYRRIWAICRIFAIGFLLIACAGRGDGRPSGQTVALKADAAQLGFDLPGFENAPVEHTRYTSADRRYREEFAEWSLADKTIAGLTLSVATAGKPFTDPTKPAEILKIWPVFDDMRPTFGNPATTESGLGRIAYRRMAIGTRACVLFIQRWPEAAPGIPTEGPANLSGFYCNPPGILLPPDAAITVMRAVVLHPPRKQS